MGLGTSFGGAGQLGPTNPQTSQVTANAIGYPPEIDGKTLLLKTLYT